MAWDVALRLAFIGLWIAFLGAITTKALASTTYINDSLFALIHMQNFMKTIAFVQLIDLSQAM